MSEKGPGTPSNGSAGPKDQSISHKRKAEEHGDDSKRPKVIADPEVVVISPLSSPHQSDSSSNEDSLDVSNHSLSNSSASQNTPKRSTFKTVTRRSSLKSASKSSTKKSDPAKEEARRLKEQERARKEEERAKKEKEKEEEKQRKEEERKAKEEEKKAKAEEKQRQLEEKKKEKDVKQKQLEEKKKKAEQEKQAKLQEKRLKEEEKARKLEEKQKAEEEKKRAQEEEKRKKELVSQKQAQKFKGFFQRLSAASNDTCNDSNVQVGPFKPFQLAPDQTLAPIVPEISKSKFSIDSFDCVLRNEHQLDHLYLKQLHSGQVKPFRTGKKLRLKIKKQPEVPSEADVTIIAEDEEGEGEEESVEPQETANKKETYISKFLGFHENNRPPWFGTWRKKSLTVTARRPFGKDIKVLNYEVDSDEEWEPEDENGESLAGSDEDEPDDDYEIDNEFMVPHGYLSDDKEEDDAMNENVCPEDPNFRENDMIVRKNLKVKPLKPVIVGPVFNSHPKLIKYGIIFNRQYSG